MKSKTYDEFVEKFKPKRSTDDCYTPPKVYEAIKNWVCIQYDIDPRCVIRPFYPGGDYENEVYADDCVVIDNPPFSIHNRICEFYLNRGIRFFLFAPTLTCLSGSACMRMNHIICDCAIIYENGAKVKTSFVTNLDDGIVAQSSPELSEIINNVIKKATEKNGEHPKYDYPDHVLTAAMLQSYAGHGIEYKLSRSDCLRIGGLDAQKEYGKKIFGSGFLISDAAAAEKVAAEKVAAEKAVRSARKKLKFSLSARELALVAKLGR